MLDITDQDSNYSSSSNSSLYKRIYDEKTPINEVSHITLQMIILENKIQKIILIV